MGGVPLRLTEHIENIQRMAVMALDLIGREIK